MRQPHFSPVGFSQAELVLATSLALVLFAPHVTASQVVAIGRNVGPTPELANAIAVGVRSYSLVALRADGSLAQWRNGATDPGVSNVVSFASGWSHGFGFQADGTLIGWGGDFGGGISEKPVNPNAEVHADTQHPGGKSDG